MTNNDVKQIESEIQKCDDTIQWYQAIIDNPGASLSAKDAARDMRRQAQREKRKLLSGMEQEVSE